LSLEHDINDHVLTTLLSSSHRALSTFFPIAFWLPSSSNSDDPHRKTQRKPKNNRKLTTTHHKPGALFFPQPSGHPPLLTFDLAENDPGVTLELERLVGAKKKSPILDGMGL